ncbi:MULTISPECIES: hypothetical protein [Bacillus cereus group]|uniref:hypothetical protein n=1 Tax=Bacillus cereus group TaxID=86661 RepID=UPI00156A91BB|nr:hypothetical protein [Bacillus cereus]NRS80196.1 hypothetical protein [Bacillus cereus]
MSDSIQVFIVLLFAIALFSILNFLAISLSGHSFKKRIVAGFIFLLLTPIIFLTIATFASIFDKAGFGAGTLAFMISVYILNGIVILLSSLFILKKDIT